MISYAVSACSHSIKADVYQLDIAIHDGGFATSDSSSALDLLAAEKMLTDLAASIKAKRLALIRNVPGKRGRAAA